MAINWSNNWKNSHIWNIDSSVKISFDDLIDMSFSDPKQSSEVWSCDWPSLQGLWVPSCHLIWEETNLISWSLCGQHTKFLGWRPRGNQVTGTAPGPGPLKDATASTEPTSLKSGGRWERHSTQLTPDCPSPAVGLGAPVEQTPKGHTTAV